MSMCCCPCGPNCLPQGCNPAERLIWGQSMIRVQSVIGSPRSEAGNSFKVHPTRPRPKGSAPCCALNPMVTTKGAGGHS
eukprot:9057742-Alexandrium_andersonii.AAC.1